MQIRNAKESVEDRLSSAFYLPLNGSHVDTKVEFNGSYDIAEGDGGSIR